MPCTTPIAKLHNITLHIIRVHHLACSKSVVDKFSTSSTHFHVYKGKKKKLLSWLANSYSHTQDTLQDTLQDTNFQTISFPHTSLLLSWPWSIDFVGHLARRSLWQNSWLADLLPLCGRITVVQWDLVWKLICIWEYSGSLAPCHVPESPFLYTHTHTWDLFSSLL